MYTNRHILLIYKKFDIQELLPFVRVGQHYRQCWVQGLVFISIFPCLGLDLGLELCTEVYQGCENSDFNLILDFFTLHKNPIFLKTFNALKKHILSGISANFRLFSHSHRRSHTPGLWSFFVHIWSRTQH